MTNSTVCRHILKPAALLVMWAMVCSADQIALIPTGGSAGTDPRPFMIGWEFSVSSPVTVTGLAFLDTTGAGLNESHMVGIFDANSGTLLVSATVPAGASAQFLNGFRVSPISYNLPAGTYVIGAQKLSNADSAIRFAPATSAVSQVQYIQERELQTSSFTIPTTNFQLDEAGDFGPDFVVASSGGPTISGLANSASFQPLVAPNTYISLFGSNLSNTTRTWQTSDFAHGVDLPVSLDGVSATVNGVSAYVEYVSPGQINLITPNGPAASGVPIVLTTPANVRLTSWVTLGESAAAPGSTLQPLAPAFFTWITGTPDSGKYLVAQHPNYTNVGKAGLFPNQPAGFTTPAKPGETIVLYGTGFGPTNPAIAPGIITDVVYPLSPIPSATVGGVTAQVTFAGLIPSLSQVYQFNVVIPASAPSGDLPLIVTVNGITSTPGLITVSQ